MSLAPITTPVGKLTTPHLRSVTLLYLPYRSPLPHASLSILLSRRVKSCGFNPQQPRQQQKQQQRQHNSQWWSFPLPVLYSLLYSPSDSTSRRSATPQSVCLEQQQHLARHLLQHPPSSTRLKPPPPPRPLPTPTPPPPPPPPLTAATLQHRSRDTLVPATFNHGFDVLPRAIVCGTVAAGRGGRGGGSSCRSGTEGNSGPLSLSFSGAGGAHLQPK